MSIWLPLESNPNVLTKYIHKLGVSEAWSLFDVLGLEPEMLEWIPQPVKSIILLFPCSITYEKHRCEEQEILISNPQKYPDNLFYMRQFTHNACGTVALIHSLANNTDIEISDGVLKSFLKKAKDLSPQERGVLLESDVHFTEDHKALALEGQTTADLNEKVNHHFIALVNYDGILYELDGRKLFPIAHGPTHSDCFVKDAAKVCKEFMARDPEELRFTVMALAPSEK